MTGSTAGASTTRERIIVATLRLIADRGIGGVTMTSIAEHAGVARQTLYNHFPDIDSIVAETVEAHRVESLDALRAVLSTIESPRARLEHLVRHSAAVAVHHHPVLAIRHGLAADVQATLRRHEGELVSIIRGTLRSGVDTGDFRSDVDVDRDAHLVKRVLDAAAELAATDPEAIQQTVAATTRTLLASVAAR